MSVFDITDDQSSWHVDALCRQFDPESWHPDPGPGMYKLEREAKSICNQCPVRVRCLTDNLLEPYGVYGGLTAKERARLRRSAA